MTTPDKMKAKRKHFSDDIVTRWRGHDETAVSLDGRGG